MSRSIDEAKLQALVQRISEADFGAGGAEERRELDAYLAENPDQAALHLSVMSLWDELGELEEPVVTSKPQALASAETGPRPRRFRLDYRVAAAILPFIAVLSVLLLTMKSIESRKHLDFTTALAERRIVTLTDGSTVSLSPLSHVRVDLRSNVRNLALLKGEALFEVASDPERPFIVSAGSGEVRAIGTAFNVRLAGPEVVVTVVEGTIRVAAGSSENGKTAKRAGGLAQLASAGEQVIYGLSQQNRGSAATNGFITPVKTVDVGRYTGWSKGLLRFDGEPLSAVIGEVNRYSFDQVRLHDNKLAQMPFYGVLHVGDTEGLISIVQDSQGIADRDLERIITVEAP
jgi:transmembrane sensor